VSRQYDGLLKRISLTLIVDRPFGRGIADATPLDVRLQTGSDGEQYELVFSDEFHVDGRSFYEGTCMLTCYRASL
jgi:Beta-glucan synthesis-associated protein SKN1/KRE6/Sbg1